MKKAIVFLGELVVLKNPKFIEEAINRNLEVLIIDQETERLRNCTNAYSNNKEHPFFKVREFFFYNNHIEIFNKFKNWNNEFDLVGFICFNEAMVNLSGMIAKLFQLPGPGLFASTVCNDKALQRKLLKEWSPGYISIEPNKRDNLLDEVGNLTFPVVCKPTARSSSSGVVLIQEKSQLLNIISGYGLDETILLEEYIKGREFSVESLVVNGKVVFSGITEKTTNEVTGEFFVEMGHMVPANNISNEEQSNLIDINKNIVETINIDSGISHAEYKIDVDGEIKLMEIAARPPGDAIIDLYSISLEYPFESLLIDIYTGNSIQSINHKKYAKQVYIDHPYGTLLDVKTDKTPVIWMYEFNNKDYRKLMNMRERVDIHSFIMYRVKNDLLSEIKSSYDRSGAFIISNEEYKELKSIEEFLLNEIEVKVV